MRFVGKKIILLGILFLLNSSFLMASDPIDIGNRRELFVDYFLIEKMSGVELQLHRPRYEDIALKFDKPWEGPFSGYITILNDSALFRMYYRGLPKVQDEKTKKKVAVTCYAESKDGIHWTKPNLGIYEIMGTKENNVVLDIGYAFSHNFSPFIDEKPGVPANERFKGVGGTEKTGLMGFVSANGIHWKKISDEPILRKGMFDSQNVVFWSAAENCYVCYLRTWTGDGYTGFRTVSRSTSPDFLHWSDPVQMDFGDTPMEHLYTNGTQPYFRAPHIYVAIAKRFFPDKAAFPEEVARKYVQFKNYRKSSSDAILMTSRGGNRYDRTFMEAFIRPGETVRDWVARDNTPALGIVPAGERKMFIYRLSHYAQSTSHVSRYSIRMDGFVSVNAPYKGGELITKPIIFSGSKLEINFDTSAAGGIQVEIQDADGNPIPGFSLSECPEFIGNQISHIVEWKNGSDVSSLAGKTVRLRFVMKDADLYSFRFFD